MKSLLQRKGIILFYIGLILCAYLCTWRFERLEEKSDAYLNNIIINEK